MFVAGGGWIGAASRAHGGLQKVEADVDRVSGGEVAGWGARGWCRWSRRRCSLHEPSPLSCAGESVLADHRRRTDGRTDRQDLHSIVVVFVVVVIVVFDK